ncbi:hypothetical protein FF011L_22030 [Roseimaritima multifibrata]|uniref:Uncharacterized protein n=1 Tax=Roseimaritima multifibrata TaxID=1930274 RepID=A0A517MEW7_9BACT|nr:efflux RND transporter periplasmic adaptor subunit [Roseimaritima multifibrata]QDS93433.1 hypothetical protein FF011L_22030 [Roseimaritima multifibrata]
MRFEFNQFTVTALKWVAGIVLVVVAGVTYSKWWPVVSGWVDATLANESGESPDAHPAPKPDLDSGGNIALEVLRLSPQAFQNLRLTADSLRPIELTDYQRSITVPAVVAAKPGRSSVVVSSPLNGVVTHVHAVTGEAVTPGALLFEVRLTYEDLVETQTAYLKTISELEVEDREIARLESATQSGAISGRQLLERRYAKEKLEAFAKSQREALRLHGLSERQIEGIGKNGKLMGDLRIYAPDVDSHDHDQELHLSQADALTVGFTGSQATLFPGAIPTAKKEDHVLIVEQLDVHKGQAIVSGETLCTLSDYTDLFIEGKAFEHDIAALTEAASNNWKVSALINGSTGQQVIDGLNLAYVSNSVDPISRTLSLFVELPNERVRDVLNSEDQRFVSWKYRVGQRLELRVPVEEWKDQIVLPAEAVVKEGTDWFVFQQSGQTFTRVPVHVRHRDQSAVVIANDGSIFPGDVVARKGAHQMQMAIKNKTGGGADPHAGHSH